MSDPYANDDAAARGARRYLTVLFADLVDSTRLGDLMDAEDYAALIGAVRQLCRQIIPRHGGHIARLQGDGVLALFGLPSASEDDGRRATEAALDLHEAVRGLTDHAGDRLALHSGIHAGLVYVLDGDLERGRFEILGNVPNVASRLSSIAAADEIVVSEESLGPESLFFELSPREAATIKGHASRLAIRRVLGRSPVKRRFDASALRGSAPFSGRQAESDAVAAALGQAAAGGGAVCLAITGGPGIGKTRFLEEAIRDARQGGWTVLRGYCENYLGAAPMQAFVQILRTLRDAPDPAGGALPAEGDALQAALDATTPAPAAAPARLPPVAAVTALFDTLAAQRPILIVLDDWQWADSASRQILDGVLALRRPLAVLLALRAPAAEAPLGAVRTIELLPLQADEASQAIGFLLPDADPFLVTEIFRYAGGNPLFIEELCHAARASGGYAKDRRGNGTAWLHALIESRVNRLPAAQAQLVKSAAVLGAHFPGWLLERITGYAPGDPLVRSLAERDLVFPAEQPGMLRFKHGVTRDVVYDSVGLREREALHRRIAQALLDDPGDAAAGDLLEPLAYHCAAGGLAAEAAHHAELAADKALAAHALDRAQVQYAAALKALDAVGPATEAARLHWCAVAQKLGMACVFDALAVEDGTGVFERAAALAAQTGDRGVRARAEYWLGYINYTMGRSRLAIRHGQAALALCDGLGDAALTAQVRATLGQSLAAAARYDEALPLLDAAIDTKRARARIGGRIAVGSAYAVVCKGAVLGDRGRFDQADECFAEALALLGPGVHEVGSSIRNWIGAVYLWQGRWDDALRTAGESVRIAEHVKSRQLLSMARGIVGYAGWMAWQRPADLQMVRDASAWVGQRHGALLSSLGHGWLADGETTLGRIAPARRAAARALAKARAGDAFGAPMGYRALARAAAAAHDAARADRYLDRALHLAAARGAPHEAAVTGLCRAAIEIERDQRRAALDSLDRASRQFEALRMPWHLGRANALRSVL